MSELWNLLESRLSDWITLKDDDFSIYEVIEIVDYSLDAGDVESFIYRNLDFMKEKNMVTTKINKDNGEKNFLLNLEGLLFVTFGWDLSTSDKRNELRYMLVKEFIENNS